MLSDLLTDEVGLHIHPMTVLLLKRYGVEYVEMPLEELLERLIADFGRVGVTAIDRLQAGRLLLANNLAWTEWDVFEKVCAAAQGLPVIWSLVQPPEPEFIAVGLETLSQFNQHTYHSDVVGYIAAACLDDGLWYLEPPLEMATEAISERDRRKGIERPFGPTADALQDAQDYITAPETHVDFQVNKVLSVRKALAEYREQVSSQLRRLQ